MARQKSIDQAFSGAKRVKTADEFRNQEQHHLERNQQLRERYARTWALVACIQLVVTFALIVAQGYKPCPWKLEPSVMMAFLGATSLNTLAVVLAISKGLFRVTKD